MIIEKVICQAKHVLAPGAEDERVTLTFAPDFDAPENEAWAAEHAGTKADLGLVITVTPAIAEQYQQGARYKLAITPED
jgi:hypothetical protein